MCSVHSVHVEVSVLNVIAKNYAFWSLPILKKALELNVYLCALNGYVCARVDLYVYLMCTCGFICILMYTHGSVYILMRTCGSICIFRYTHGSTYTLPCSFFFFSFLFSFLLPLSHLAFFSSCLFLPLHFPHLPLLCFSFCFFPFLISSSVCLVLLLQNVNNSEQDESDSYHLETTTIFIHILVWFAFFPCSQVI